MAKRNIRKEDPRLICMVGDHPFSTYRIEGVNYAIVEHNAEDNEYPWTACALDVETGRMLSGIFNSYQTSSDAVDAILDGSWQEN